MFLRDARDFKCSSLLLQFGHFCFGLLCSHLIVAFFEIPHHALLLNNSGHILLPQDKDIDQGVSDRLKNNPEAKKKFKHQFALINHNIFVKTNWFTWLTTKSRKKQISEDFFVTLFGVFSRSYIFFFYLHCVKRFLNCDNIVFFLNEI